MPTLAVRPLPAPLPTLQPLPVGARVIVVDEPRSYPCRRCLRDAEPGEHVLLLSYDPFEADAESPYRQPGPIFVHADPCSYEPDGGLPGQLTRRLLSIRRFAADHTMLGGVVVQGTELEGTAVRLLDDDAVAYLHVHNAGPGCFAARIDRDPDRRRSETLALNHHKLAPRGGAGPRGRATFARCRCGCSGQGGCST